VALRLTCKSRRDSTFHEHGAEPWDVQTCMIPLNMKKSFRSARLTKCDSAARMAHIMTRSGLIHFSLWVHDTVVPVVSAALVYLLSTMAIVREKALIRVPSTMV
jgi:hypothetical protein